VGSETIVLLALLAGAVLLGLLTLGFVLMRPKRIPRSAGGPHKLNVPRGRPPDLRGSRGSTVGGPSTDRAEQIIRDLRVHAADELISFIGGVYAPDALYALLAETADPTTAVARLIELLGEDPTDVMAGPGPSRATFLDRLDAFVQLEAEFRAIDPDSNRQIFTLLSGGHADAVRLWATAVRSARETEALLTQVETLAPGQIGLVETLRRSADALSGRARAFPPTGLEALVSELNAVKLSAEAVFRFADDWHAIDRRRDAAEAEIGARWDPDDPFCKTLFARMDLLFAKLESSWKAIAHKRTGVAELRGLLDEMERVISSLTSIADELKAHSDSSAHTDDASASGGPHARRSGTYGPDGRDKTARAHADAHRDLWAFFGFDYRPTLEECRAARNAKLRLHHPDIIGPAGHKAMQEINARWAAAKTILEGVTA
jgi:hypothetical protein